MSWSCVVQTRHVDGVSTGTEVVALEVSKASNLRVSDVTLACKSSTSPNWYLLPTCEFVGLFVKL